MSNGWNEQLEVLREKARFLRASPTAGEEAFWELVKGRRFHGHRFRRQVVIDPYIVDFFCRDLDLVVEIDGGLHENQRSRDIERDADLKRRGYYVFRFTNEDVIESPGKIRKILDAWRGEG